MLDSDLFPATPRYRYNKAPLLQVTIQLRYPAILRIQSETPAAFQENIRETFPLLQRTVPVIEGFPGQQIPTEVIQMLTAGTITGPYQFVTEDQQTTVALAPEALALTTRAYTQWEAFRAFLDIALNALVEVYKPSFFSRVGLRYVNAISREPLGLKDRHWSQLIRKELLGEIAIPAFEEKLVSARRALRLNTGDSLISFQHGTSNVKDRPGQSYTLDFDFFKDTKTELDGARQFLDEAHSNAFRAFRWSITDTLHDAMEPTSLE